MQLAINVECMQAIEVSHLVKKFGALTAVSDISFSVGLGRPSGF
jgi:ABC-2 type transport system ATP-binding protein